MMYSKLFGKTVRDEPSESVLSSHKLLYKAGYIRDLVSGRYSLLPLGERVAKKIIKIIEEEMDRVGGQRITTPTFHPIELWQRSGRIKTMSDVLTRVKDKRGAEFALGATHEEVFVDLVEKFALSEKDLPVILYQFSNKFRDETRARGGLIRVREFLMKDAYSFNATAESLDKTYEEMFKAYGRIFEKLGIKAVAIEADSGAIGGKVSHEFMAPSKDGEDEYLECSSCGYKANREKVGKENLCPKCKNVLKINHGIEVGHVFRLDDYYSTPMNATFTASDGTKKKFLMGCYGIGIERNLATIVEQNHDEKGIIWPKSVAPFDVHLISLNVNDKAQKVYEELTKAGIEVLYDDREVSAGVKFADYELIGIPIRLVVSAKTGDMIEYKERNGEVKLLDFEQILPLIKGR